MRGYSEYGLVKLMVVGLCAVAVLSIGVLGLGGSGGWPDIIAWSKGKIAKVLVAAPFKVTRVVPEKEQLIKLYAPPAYSKRTSLNTQLVQSSPSSDWVTSSKINSSNFGKATKGLKVGSEPVRTMPLLPCAAPPPLNTDLPCVEPGACGVVDAWLPKDWFPANSKVLQAPTTNDSNASIVLDINPPTSGQVTDCVLWRYHYGTPPTRGNAARL